MKTVIAIFIQIIIIWNEVVVHGEESTNKDSIPSKDIPNKTHAPKVSGLLDILTGIHIARNFPVYTSQIYFIGPNWESILRWHTYEYSSTVMPTENISKEKNQYDDINSETDISKIFREGTNRSHNSLEGDMHVLQNLDDIDFSDTVIQYPLNSSDRLTRNTKSKNISQNIVDNGDTTTHDNEDDYMNSTEENEMDETTSFKSDDNTTNIAVPSNKSTTTTTTKKPSPMSSYGPPSYQPPLDHNKTDSVSTNSTTGWSNIGTPKPTISSYGPPASGLSSYYSHWSSRYPDTIYSVPPTSNILHGNYGPSRTPGVEQIWFTTERPNSSFKPSFPDYFRNYMRPAYADLFLPMVYRSESEWQN